MLISFMKQWPAQVDEGGGQHGFDKTGRDKHAGGNGQVGFHEHVGLGLAGKHGVGQDRAADGERQTGQHGFDDRTLPYCMRQRLACVLGLPFHPCGVCPTWVAISPVF